MSDRHGETEELLTAILRAATEPMCLVDPDGQVRFANDAALAALGYATGDDISICLPTAAGEAVARDLDWFAGRDGSRVPISYSSVPVEAAGVRQWVVTFPDTEGRLRQERRRREHETMLAAQRRIATRVAGGAPSAEVFAAIAEQVGEVIGLPLVVVWRYEAGDAGTVLGAWSQPRHPFHPGSRWSLDGDAVSARVRQTGRPVRIDDLTGARGTIADAQREAGIRSCAAAPIIVDGEAWGAVAVHSRVPAPLPDQVEHRLAEITELVATAISSSAGHDDLTRLVDEQTALRRVATLVAQGVPPQEVFAAVAREVGLLLGVDAAYLARYSSDGMAVGVATWSTGEEIPVGRHVALDEESVVGIVSRTGRSARIDCYADVDSDAGALVRELGLGSSVGAPIVVEQRLWGVLIVSRRQNDRPLPPDTEGRVEAFTELVATAISNAESRIEVARLAEEQAALRRVAELVAREAGPTEIFTAIAAEIGTLLGTDEMRMMRYESDADVVVVAAAGPQAEVFPIGSRWPLGGEDVTSRVFRSGQPARIEDYRPRDGRIAETVRSTPIRAVVGTPIVVQGRVWGAMLTGTLSDEPLPPDTESRLAQFTELMATAIANAESRAELASSEARAHGLAQEQAALRRIATLVAQGAPAEQLFPVVARETADVFDVELATLCRYETDTFVVLSSNGIRRLAAGSRWSLDAPSLPGSIYHAGAPVRVDHYTNAVGPDAVARDLGVKSAVGVPITVDGTVWGSVTIASTEPKRFPADAEGRLARFTELVAMSVSNTGVRAELAASRARLIEAADKERRRVVRDLHDGVQQRLVHTELTLQLARRTLGGDLEGTVVLIDKALEHARAATDELRDLAHGILPSILTSGGLRAGVNALASRMPIEVETRITVDRLSPTIEATAYFVVAEALTNVVKHAHARRVVIDARIDSGALRLELHDDGIGGARSDGGGLTGLRDRIAALDGSLMIESPANGGTLIAVAIPLR